MLSASELLSANGPLSREIESFTPRIQQQAMAELVAKTLEDYGTLVCEAGTGTGKTFAYLVPALMSGKKIIISTGTRNLQDQLFHRDLPLVRKALRLPVTVALLKGRTNYLCLYRLEQSLEGGHSRLPEVQSELLRVAAWAKRTQSGDVAELADVPESSAVWPLVTSTSENCLGQDCPLFEECYVVKARREAAAADVVVVNHHLFLADMALRDEGFGEVLPGAEAVIFDEAHQLPEVATQFFGVSLSSRQLIELARDSVAAELQEAGDMPGLAQATQRLEQSVRDFRQVLGESEQRAAWQTIARNPEVTSSLRALTESLSELKVKLEPAAERGPALESCERRCREFAERLALFSGKAARGEGRGEDPSLRNEEGHLVQWFETHARSFVLHATPLEVAEPFRARLGAYKSAWIFTSATLAVGDDFSHFKRRVGLSATREARWNSPYNYSRQALMYLPVIDRDPREAGYTAAVVEAALPVLEASKGRAFLLFTSRRALLEAQALLRGRIPFLLLVQGEAPRGELLKQFRRNGNAVLLGTSSFWEGVDVRGEILSLVIIDKLPFASPDDPILQARIQAIRDQGQNPFMEYQLPEAVITLKQGVGRLIRDEHDRGVLMLCDPRLLRKSYGQMFLAALPPMRCTRELSEVQEFFGHSPGHRKV